MGWGNVCWWAEIQDGWLGLHRLGEVSLLRYTSTSPNSSIPTTANMKSMRSRSEMTLTRDGNEKNRVLNSMRRPWWWGSCGIGCTIACNIRTRCGQFHEFKMTLWPELIGCWIDEIVVLDGSNLSSLTLVVLGVLYCFSWLSITRQAVASPWQNWPIARFLPPEIFWVPEA